ncbi:MAG: hypothetical protein ISR44_02130 [Rhodospirillales bacterium]|nr:hypothetical protein [Rhodospirillales bacterium]
MSEELQADVEREDQAAVVAGGEPAASKKPKRLILYLVVSCVVIIAAAVSGWLYLALPELNGDEGIPIALSVDEIALRKAEREKEAEATANWQNYHCNFFHKYYDGDEVEFPLGELLGLAADADQDAIEERCEELLPAVRFLGGWPTSRPKQDNIVVCDGFKFIIKGGVPVEITPTRENLAQGVVAYGLGKEETRTQAIQKGQTTRVGRFAPLVVQADDRCVVVGVRRLPRGGAVAGRVVRITAKTASAQQKGP